MISLQTLGGIDLRDPEGRPLSAVLSQPQLFAVLVYLVGAEPGTFHRRDTLIGLIWPEAPEPRARRRLNQVLYELRQALGDPVVVSRAADEVGIPTGMIRSDLHGFRSALDDGRREEALELYRGPFLNGFHLSHAPGLARWLDHQRELLRRSAVEAASSLVSDLSAGGDLSAARSWARRACEMEPYSEPGIRTHMQVLQASGDRAGAIEAFESFRNRLADEYQMEPSETTLELAEAIRKGRPGAERQRPPEGHQTVRSTASEASSVHYRRPVQQSQTATPNLGRTLAGAGIALAGFAAVLWAVLAGSGTGMDKTSVASGLLPVVLVVPIDVGGAVPSDLGDLGTALTRELRQHLGRIPGLVLVPHEVIAPRVREGTPPLDIARSLAADVVVEGSLEWGPSGGRSAAEVIDVASGEMLWNVEHQHAPEDLVQAQRDITVGIASVLGLSSAGASSPELPAEDELGAWAYVEQARELLASENLDQDDHDRVEVLLARALDLSPGDAVAHALRARAFRLRWGASGQRRWLDSARVTAEHAVSMNPNHYLPQVELVEVLDEDNQALTPEQRRRRFEAALRAVQLNPNDPRVVLLSVAEWMGVGRSFLWGERARALSREFGRLYFYRGHWFWILGEYDASLRAWERLSDLVPEPAGTGPGSSGYETFRIPELHFSRGALALAQAGIDAVLRERPDPSQGAARIPLWARAYPTAVALDLVAGRYESAEQLLEELLERESPIEAIGTSNFDTGVALAYVYLKTGRTDEGTELLEATLPKLLESANRSVRTGAYGSAYSVARAYALLGDLDEAVRWMGVAIDRGWIWYYTALGPTDPLLENVRDDPRFIAQMEGVKALLDSERAWVQQVLALPEADRLDVMLLDAERQLEAIGAEVEAR